MARRGSGRETEIEGEIGTVEVSVEMVKDLSDDRG